MISTQPKVVAVIQARVGSTRLPGKVLRNLKSRPVLEWVVRAARAAEGIDDVVIATSTEASDNVIADFAREQGIQVVRGSESDVLARFLQAVSETGADAVVRLTADCPLLDPEIISQIVAIWRRTPDFDYVSTTLVRSLPRGLDVELVTADALSRVGSREEAHHRAHVTSGVYEEGSGFSCAGLTMQPGYSHYRVTLDTSEDLAALDALTSLLPDGLPAWSDIVQVLNSHPEIVALNAEIEQKALIEG